MTLKQLNEVNALREENRTLKQSAEDARRERDEALDEAEGLRRKIDRMVADAIDAGFSLQAHHS